MKWVHTTEKPSKRDKQKDKHSWQTKIGTVDTLKINAKMTKKITIYSKHMKIGKKM